MMLFLGAVMPVFCSCTPIHPTTQLKRHHVLRVEAVGCNILCERVGEEHQHGREMQDRRDFFTSTFLHDANFCIYFGSMGAE